MSSPKIRTPANEVEQYKLPKARESDDLRPKTGRNWMREAKDRGSNPLGHSRPIGQAQPSPTLLLRHQSS